MNGCKVANNIRTIALQFGTLTSFKAYVDVALEGPRAIALQAQLQASGVSMIHCPHASMKEVVDRALTGEVTHTFEISLSFCRSDYLHECS